MPATLGYWNYRGFAQPIRLLLEYTGTAYEEKRYEYEPEPGSTTTTWTSDKFSLGLDFPNLPYLIDGDIKITQSDAIMRYIARKNNLCGETEEERIRVDLMANQAYDFRNDATAIANSPNVKEQMPGYLKDVPSRLKQFSKFLGSKQWFTGNKLTFVDFTMYDTLDVHRTVVPTLLDDFENLKDFLARFEALPQIAAYMKSDRFMGRSIFRSGVNDVIFGTK